MRKVGAAAPWAAVAGGEKEEEGRRAEVRCRVRRRREPMVFIVKGEGVVCEGGPAAPTAASSAALRRLWRRSLRREEGDIEVGGVGESAENK